uniref:Reverse transcriptase domain-containing protein n=1 Tax=Tanacetum cinerariifolium TaxID=118510 RepID=A0A6L2K257_TANCI|nr:reverse transcriptase domain-containing protein [Tanacetum cinerariifolium]
MREFCEKHYAQILPFMAEKAHNQKLKDVRSRLTYREDTEQENKSASRHKKRKRRGGKQKETQKHPHSRQVCSLAWEPKSKNIEGNMRENSYEARLILANANGKMNESTEGAKGPPKVMSSWKVRIAPEEGTERDNQGKPEGTRKRYTKDLVELYHVKQKEGESMEAFMERYTSEIPRFKGAPELMRISRFMHGITYPGLIKRLNDNIPKTVDEMMSTTKAFIRREKVNMDDPNITMEEYIRLEEEKACRRGQVYNWETAMYGKIWYDEDVHYLRSFKKEFPAIIYNDALTCKSDFSPQPTISPQHIDEFNLKNKTSLSECDGE